MSLQAQDNNSGYYVGWKGSKIELHTISDHQQACTVLMNADSVRVFVSRGQGAISYLCNLPRLKKEKFLGGFFREGSLYLFLNNGQAGGVHSFRYNFSSRNLAEHVIPFDRKESRLTKRFSTSRNFFYYTINKSLPALVIHKFNNDTVAEKHIFKISHNVITQLTVEGKGAFGDDEVEVETADMVGECDIENAQSAHKIYVRNDSLFMVLNDETAVSNVYSLDIERNTFSTWNIQHNRVGGDTKKEVSNSFLLGDKLYYASGTRDSLLVEINDFYTGKVLQDFRAGGKDEIDFKNTPIVQEGSGFFIPGSRILNNASQLLKKVTGGKIVITATPNNADDKVCILVGSYKEMQSGGFVSTPGAPGFPGPMIMPGGDSWIKSARFKMLVNADCSHTEGQVPLSVNDKFERYTRNIEIRTDNKNLFMLKGEYYYIFYNEKLGELSLIVF